MKSFKQHLQEKNVQTLYHVTNLWSCASLLKEGMTPASSNIVRHDFVGIDDKVVARALGMQNNEYIAYAKKIGLTGYISFARHPNNAFTKHMFHNEDIVAILRFDARKLSRYGKIISVDYSAVDGDTVDRRSEQEERMICTTETINVLPAITDISLVSNSEYEKIVGSYPNDIKAKYPGTRLFPGKDGFKNYLRSRP